ncbi:alpha-ketoglutarate-dependent dioxygenase alkB homolog 4 isoform X2 [Leguminivora glycinivorella]|uniref:alpha-ketoglutarate-dependent dioxygenase alkB homolog 4 isoform X2 n=1 Tax=Leguminivora glycinivorella TaxID=1035111 RepID=UPI00200D525A|nr:alpha-ketoglutarate-dependent dioxygenase alkB homolog 4 isoform X2 [Leguminivora glycinivorella]
MTQPRPCGCKGCRTCLICETQYGADKYKIQLEFDKTKSYVYCPFCNKAWPGWDADIYKQHPNHNGTPIEYPGVYIQLDFITEEEENVLMKNIDEVPWDISQSGRRKQNYGPKTNFKKMKINAGSFDGFPAFSKFLQDRRSLLVFYGEPRYHWEHCVLREDISSRRVCIAYREFTPPYMQNGCHEEAGNLIRQAKTFWDHKVKYQIQT